jgi:hypothetical protein
MAIGTPRRPAALPLIGLGMALLTATAGLAAPAGAVKKEFTDEFMIEACAFETTGSNPFFKLEPGYQLVLEGREDREDVKVVITVLDETKMVGGVQTRVIEERETKDGELVEVSRNYYARCTQTNSVFYFGEDVDNYEDGVIVDHEGAWLAGQNGARPGIIMPGTVLLGARYYQEIAPNDDALDRAEIVSLDETVNTPAGTFSDVLKTIETTPLEKGKSTKLYAPGVGLIQDGSIKLTSYGAASTSQRSRGR